MLKKQVLFVIHDLHLGGAEKVLVNLVNHMDRSKFDVTVLALFGGGVNEPFLNPDIRLIVGHKRPFPGNSRIMKLFSPERLFRYYIKGRYDAIVSYLEGPSARIVSGCPRDGTKAGILGSLYHGIPGNHWSRVSKLSGGKDLLWKISYRCFCVTRGEDRILSVDSDERY